MSDAMDRLWGELRSWCNDPERSHHELHGLLERSRGVYRLEMTRYVWTHAEREALHVRAHYALLAIAACPTTALEEEISRLLLPGASRAVTEMLRDGAHALLSARFDLEGPRVRRVMWRVMASLRAPGTRDVVSQTDTLAPEDPRLREAFLSILACVYELCGSMPAEVRARHVEQAFPLHGGSAHLRARGLWADLAQDFEAPRLW